MWQPLPPGRKPTGPVEINWDHKFGKYLRGCWLFPGSGPLHVPDVTGNHPATLMNPSVATAYDTTGSQVGQCFTPSFTTQLQSLRPANTAVLRDIFDGATPFSIVVHSRMLSEQ